MKKKIVTTVTEEIIDDTTTKGGLLVNVILDMSGSMSSRVQDTIGGFNSYKNGLKEIPNCKLSLTLFDNQYERIYTALDIREVPDLTSAVYQPRGSTALFDAVGRTIREVEYLSSKPSKIMYAIITDGDENASHEYSKNQISDMIVNKARLGWEFVYLGANVDAWTAGSSMGISHNYNWNATRSAAMYSGLITATNSYSRGIDFGVATASCLSDLNGANDNSFNPDQGLGQSVIPKSKSK